jgi:histidinol-phosphate aminotransferase
MRKIDLKNTIRKNILELEPYSCARNEYFGDEGIFLDANENPYGLLNRYPDPIQCNIKHKIQELTGIDENRVFIGNGSDEVIDMVFRIFCNPGIDKALCFPPTYGMYKVAAAVNDVEMIELPLLDNFQINLYDLLPFFDDPQLKVVFICSPNNPTGNLMRQYDIMFILNHFEGIVFVDEAYIDFADSKSMVSEIDHFQNLIVAQTFSKSRALASARIGIAYANPSIIYFYNRIKAPYNISELNQKAALEALMDEKEFLSRKAAILKEKQRLKKAFSKIPLIKKVHHSDANFFLVEVDDANKVYSMLISMKIVTRNRSSLVNNCIRITVGTHNENTALLDALKYIANTNQTSFPPL